MKKAFTMLMIGILSASCIGAKSINETIHERFSTTKMRSLYGQNFSITNKVGGGDLVQTKKTKSVKIPAFFYWKFQNVFESDMNPYIPVNLFNKYADDYAETLHFRDRLANRTIELNVVDIPKNFEFSQSNTVIFLLVAGVTSESNYMKSLSSELKVEYQIHSGNQITDSGTILINDADLRRYDQQLSLTKQSTTDAKKFITNYFDLYDNYIYLMSKAFVDKLNQKI